MKCVFPCWGALRIWLFLCSTFFCFRSLLNCFLFFIFVNETLLMNTLVIHIRRRVRDRYIKSIFKNVVTLLFLFTFKSLYSLTEPYFYPTLLWWLYSSAHVATILILHVTQRLFCSLSYFLFVQFLNIHWGIFFVMDWQHYLLHVEFLICVRNCFKK